MNRRLLLLASPLILVALAGCSGNPKPVIATPPAPPTINIYPFNVGAAIFATAERRSIGPAFVQDFTVQTGEPGYQYKTAPDQTVKLRVTYTTGADSFLREYSILDPTANCIHAVTSDTWIVPVNPPLDYIPSNIVVPGESLDYRQEYDGHPCWNPLVITQPTKSTAMVGAPYTWWQFGVGGTIWAGPNKGTVDDTNLFTPNANGIGGTNLECYKETTAWKQPTAVYFEDGFYDKAGMASIAAGPLPTPTSCGTPVQSPSASLNQKGRSQNYETLFHIRSNQAEVALQQSFSRAADRDRGR